MAKYPRAKWPTTIKTYKTGVGTRMAWKPLHPWIGLYERAVFVVPSIWMGAMSVRLVKRG
jgi:hypothetical protein